MTVKAPPATLGPREVARQCGVSADTLRHYERKGLLPRPARTRSGYRRYPPETVARVLLVQRALVVGFTLDELARVLRERERGEPPCRGVRDLVAARLDDLDGRLRELTALRRELRQLLGSWDRTLAATPSGQPAHLLQSLVANAALARAPRRTPIRRSKP
jgi:MerR family transcriptional regulator, Zn(II)-responsive regulator of zntA